MSKILYEMLTSFPPFEGRYFDSLLHNILNLKINWPKDIDTDAKDLIEKILVKDPKKRIGYGSKDYKEIKSHIYFKDINISFNK